MVKEAGNPYVIGSPPRLAGQPLRDVHALLKWVTDLYRVLVIEIDLGRVVTSLKKAVEDHEKRLTGIQSTELVEANLPEMTIPAEGVASGIVLAERVLPTDFVWPAMASLPPEPVLLSARAQAHNTVRWFIMNTTGSPVVVPGGTLRLLIVRAGR